MNSRKIALVVALAALSISTNYAMISLPNIKLMDLVVFVGGFCFGSVVGAFTGIVSWVVYGSMNPQGFSLPIWIAAILSECVYGIGGAFMRRSMRADSSRASRHRVSMYAFFGVLGVFLTLAYDVATNVVFGYVYYGNVLFAIIVGFVPFGLVHVLSNAFFFSVGCVPAISAVSKLVGGDYSGFFEK